MPNSRLPPRRVQAVVGGAVVVVAVAAALATRAQEAATVVVTRRHVVESSVASGRVVAPSRAEVGVVVAGVVVEVAVAEGDVVEAGAVLLRIDDANEAAAVAQAKASLAQALAQLRDVVEVQRGRAAAQLAIADAELARAAAQTSRSARLLVGGSTTPVEVEDVRTALALAQARRDAAAVDARATGDGGSKVRLAEAQVEAARAALLAAEARLAQTKVVARVGARVLRRDVEPGDAVTPGKTLLVLARTGAGALELVVEPDEKSLAVLREGQAASAVADAFPAAPFAAVVKEIAPVVDAGRGTVEVRLAVPEPPAFLHTDMTVSVEITTGEKHDALVVPLDAVRDRATRAPFVLVVVGDVARRRPVTLGARGTDDVEVTAGLAEGDVVVTDARIKADARVRSAG